MTVKVILGLPYLSKGPITTTARALNAPILLSANSFSTWTDDGPAPPAFSINGRPRQIRNWKGWNTNQLAAANGFPEVWLDSAGFHAMFQWRGYPWTPADYILGLCAAFPFTRFSSMDLCVEEEVAADVDLVNERISRTIALNRDCKILADDAGIGSRLMHVIQGADSDSYLRCFDALHHLVGDNALIGVGSMCRRKTNGSRGIISIIEDLDRRLPTGIKLHLFGLKSDGAESVAMLTHRVESIDSQAYGVHARQLANKRRKSDPQYSKTNTFVASVMRDWYLGQQNRMSNAVNCHFQPSLPICQERIRPVQTVFEAIASWTRSQHNWLIETAQLNHDDMLTHNSMSDLIQDLITELPGTVSAFDKFQSIQQLPSTILDNLDCIPDRLLHPALAA